MASYYRSQQLSEIPSFQLSTSDLTILCDGLVSLAEEPGISGWLMACFSEQSFNSLPVEALKRRFHLAHLATETLALAPEELLLLFCCSDLAVLVSASRTEAGMEARFSFDPDLILKVVRSLPSLPRAESVVTELMTRLPYCRCKIDLASRLLLRVLQHHQVSEVSEARMMRLAEQSLDLIYRIQLNPRFQILYISPIVETWMGCTRDELYRDARIAFKHIHPDDAAVLQRMMVEDNAKQGVTLVRFMPASGDPYWIEHRWFVDRSTDRSVIVLDGVGRDISRQKRQEEAIGRTLRAAEENVRAKSLFLANMSHEIRTPLNAVIGQVELLKATPLNTDQQEMLDSVLSAGQILLSHLTDVLDFSRLDAQRVKLQNSPFSPVDAISEAIGLVKDTAREKGLNLLRSYDPSTPALVVGDKPKLIQIILNLLSNALKFTESGTVKLELGCKSLADIVTLNVRISDTGIGFPVDDFASLCLPFSQVDPSTTRKREGAGLGLAIVTRLVELMEAEISVESEPDSGTVFHLSFPFQSAHTKLTWTDKLASDFQAELGQGKQFSTSLAFRELATAETALLAHFNLLSESSAQTLRLPGEPSKTQNDIVLNVPLNPRAFLQTVLGAEPQPEPSDGPDLPTELSLLVVEDNQVNRKVLNRQLENLGVLDVDFAQNGREALEIFRPGRHRVVLMDIQMPDMDGVDTMRRLKELHPRLPVPFVAVTAHALPGDRETYLEAGFHGYLSKPVGLAALRKTLLQVLNDQA